MFSREKEIKNTLQKLHHLILLLTEEKKRVKDKAIASCMYIIWILKTGEIFPCLAVIFRLTSQSLSTGLEWWETETKRERQREGKRKGGKEKRRERWRKEAMMKQRYVHYSTLASKEGAPDLPGNMLMTLFQFPCKKYGFPGGNTR